MSQRNHSLKIMANDKNKLLKDRATFLYRISFDSVSAGSCWNKHRKMKGLAISTLKPIPQKILLEPITSHFRYLL